MNIQTFDVKQQIEHDFNGLHLIEASAGTGKTYTITNLFLRASLLEDVPVKNILMVTFTKAATADLQNRIYQRVKDFRDFIQTYTYKKNNDDFFLILYKKLKEKLTDEKRIQDTTEFVWQSLDELYISTIHGFCQRVLQDYPFLTKITKDIQIQPQTELIVNPIIKDWWRINVIGCSSFDYWFFSTFGWNNMDSFGKEISNAIKQNIIVIPQIKDTKIQKIKKEFVEKFKILKRIWQEEKKLLVETLNSNKLDKRTAWHNHFLQLDYFITHKYQKIPINSIKTLCIKNIKNKLKKEHNIEELPEKTLYQQIEIFYSFLQDDGIIQQTKAYYLSEAILYTKTIKTKRCQKDGIFAYDDLVYTLKNITTDKRYSKKITQQLIKDKPVAFIDEFQDTDDVQYKIFKNIYFDNLKKGSLYLIGDPKQAIYQFRGADVFTYIQAKEDIIKNKGGIFTLNTNYRATDNYIKTINYIFSETKNPFLFEKIVFKKSHSPCGKNFSYLTYQNKLQPAIEFISSYNANITEAISKISQAIANHVVELLNKNYKIANKKVKATDIAILVNTHDHAKEIANALYKKNIYCIIDEKHNNVFAEKEADYFLYLMQAVNDYKNITYVNNLIFSGLFGFCPNEIQKHIKNKWQKKLAKLQNIWQRYGVLTMFLASLEILNLGVYLKQQDNFNRKYSNLLQLSQVLSENIKNYFDLDKQILTYQILKSQKPQSGIMKLATDEHLIQVFTIHHAKGLQYNIVFLPYLWLMEQKNKETKPPIIYHENGKIIYDYLPEQTNKEIYKKEQQSEEIRKLYVAMTRARTCSFVYWHFLDKPKNNPLQTILKFENNFTKIIDNNDIRETDISTYQKPQIIKDNKKQIKMRTLAKTPKIKHNCQVQSFTSLAPLYQKESPKKQKQNNDDIMQISTGIKTGDTIHNILENIDFQKDIKKQMSTLDITIKKEERPIWVKWIDNIINTKINKDSLTLKKIAKKNKKTEMSFDFYIQNVDIKKLNIFLKKILLAGEEIIHNNFSGIMTGFIDLVFCHNKKYYICDYKTNLISLNMKEYNVTNMEQEIAKHRYDLQYAIYSVALHRHLQQSLPSYDYQIHFGGIYYFFVRAMRKQNKNLEGIYFYRFTQEQVEYLDKYIFINNQND
jgi:exodeoxyribonuclease V beta subunit